MPRHFSKWMFGKGSWNRTLLRPLHPLTWYGSTCRNSAPLSGERESMNNRLVTSFSVFSVFCSGYLSREGFCFVLPTCDFLLPCWGSLLRSTVSCEGHIHGPTLCKISFNFENTVYGAVQIIYYFCFFLIRDYFFYPVDKALLPTPNRSLKQCGFAGVLRGRPSGLGIF